MASVRRTERKMRIAGLAEQSEERLSNVRLLQAILHKNAVSIGEHPVGSIQWGASVESYFCWSRYRRCSSKEPLVVSIQDQQVEHAKVSYWKCFLPTLICWPGSWAMVSSWLIVLHFKIILSFLLRDFCSVRGSNYRITRFPSSKLPSSGVEFLSY